MTLDTNSSGHSRSELIKVLQLTLFQTIENQLLIAVSGAAHVICGSII